MKNQINFFKTAHNRRINKSKKVFKYCSYLATFANKVIKKTKRTGYVVGLSGGIDSSLTWAILNDAKQNKANNKWNLCGIFINIDSQPLDVECFEKIKKQFPDNTYLSYDLTGIYNQLVTTFNLRSQISKNNLKSRLRSNCLYAIANQEGKLVCGTTNADEFLLGFYTKFGDSACDVNLLGRLTKSKINFLSEKKYHLPVEIIQRQPSSGLQHDVNDEQELGVTYLDVDRFLVGDLVEQANEMKIIQMFKSNQHKLAMPIKPKRFYHLRLLKNR